MSKDLSPTMSLKEYGEHEAECQVEQQDIARVPTVHVDNYHGLHASTVLVYFAIWLATFAQIVNLVGASLLARNIATAVGGSSEMVWLSQSIAILTFVMAPPVSQAADLWGRKWFIVILTSLGVLGAIVVARATSMGMAIAGEVIGGIAFGSQPLLYAVASEILPRRLRPAAQGGLNVAISCAGIMSLLVGTTLEKKYADGFRIYWYMQAGINALVAMIVAVLYNPPLRPLQKSLTLAGKLKRLDWVGYALLASGVVLFSMALTWSDNPYGWTDAHILAPFILGILLLLCTAVHQTVFKKDGMFHHGLFRKDRNFALSLGCIFVEGMVFFAANNFFPSEMALVYEPDPLRVGMRFSITFIAAIVGALAISAWAYVTRSLRGPIVLAFLSFVVFYVLMATSTLETATALWSYPLFLGLGLGVCLTCIVTAAQLSAPPALIAITSGLLVGLRSLGGSIALPIYNAIFNSQVKTHLGSDVAAAVVPLGFPIEQLPQLIEALAGGDPTAVANVPGLTPGILHAATLALKTAFLKSFRFIWVTAAVFSFLAAIAAGLFINPKDDLNMHVDAPLEEESAQAERA